LYKPFSEITSAALKHALLESSVSLTDENISKLMKAYNNLGTFPDVKPGLDAITSDPSIDAYVFSNGSDEMVTSSVNESPSLSAHASIFKGLVTVQEIEVFKPDPTVYHHLVRKVGKSFGNEDMASVWLVSGNPFDIVGARAAGINAAWVDRGAGHSGNGGWTDQLGTLASGGPTISVSGVEEAVKGIKKFMAEDTGGSVVGHNKESAAMGPG
jgi:2-haloacid dehalogenase